MYECVPPPPSITIKTYSDSMVYLIQIQKKSGLRKFFASDGFLGKYYVQMN
jgi:hypothetical protein